MSVINLSKGNPPVRLTKTAAITATASWSSSTDYDLYALVVGRDGAVHHVANFGAKNKPAQRRGVGGVPGGVLEARVGGPPGGETAPRRAG